MAKWVRHISGQGEKWEVNEKYTECGEWCVIAKDDGVRAKIHWLPKSEYKECEPLEEWEDVSRDCYVTFSTLLEEYKVVCIGHNRQHLYEAEGYRLRKIDGLHNGPAFIVERRKG